MNCKVPSISFYNASDNALDQENSSSSSLITDQISSENIRIKSEFDSDDLSTSPPSNKNADQQDENSSNSSDLIFPRDVKNAVQKLRDFDSDEVSEQENLDDVDYCPMAIDYENSDDNEDEFIEDSDLDEESRPIKKKRKKAEKHNPYKSKRKLKRSKNDDELNEIAQEIKNKTCEFSELDNGFKLPSKLWNKLYPYQQAGIQWLWGLHQNSCGGCLGDDCGLF